MSKNIVVLSDGTSQEGGRGHDSNVYKFYRMLEDRTEDQIVFYDEGLGTDSRKFSGSAFGVGFSENLLQCYKFIFENYNAGDKLFLLGFSRGAATVRSLSNFIHYFGILPRARPKLIRQAFKLYENRRQPNLQEEEILEEDSRKLIQKLANRGMRMVNSAAYKVYSTVRKDLDEVSKRFVTAHPNQWVSIEFLGVWDTVPALGFIPMAGVDLFFDRFPWWKHSFHDFKLHPSVKNAYQALSIDDDRKWFFPTIWNQYDDEAWQTIKQVWFSGAHTDIGGGFDEPGLSDIVLEWMAQNARRHGIKLYLKSRRYWNFCVAPDAMDKLHPAREGWSKVFKYGVRDKVWDDRAFDTFGPPLIHETVLERARRDPAYRPWILKNYPDPEKWLQKNLEKELRKKHKADTEARYQDWYAEKWMTGEANLPTLEAWLVDNSLTYEEWLSENRMDENEWLKQNDLALETFEGIKFMVECSQKSDLRDYDEQALQEILEKAFLDQHAGDDLWERAMMNGRLVHDRNRWNTSTNAVIETQLKADE